MCSTGEVHAPPRSWPGTRPAWSRSKACTSASR
jgi:hypothetical protein